MRSLQPSSPGRAGVVTAVFSNPTRADAAYRRALDLGYDDTEISVLMTEEAREHLPVESPVEPGRTRAVEGAGIGGALGLGIGALAGALAAIGTAVAFPGIGLIVAGPIAAGVAAAGAAGVAGGIAGALVGHGVTEDLARTYSATLGQGGVVLAVEPPTPAEAATIQRVWQEAGGEYFHCARTGGRANTG